MMNRRQLLKISALCGLGATVPSLARETLAQGGGYAGPYWLFITAGGGWDPRFMFDPTLNVEQNRLYTEIGSVGNISFAPLPLNLDDFGLAPEPAAEPEVVEGDAGVAPVEEPEPPPPNPLITHEEFLNRHGSRMLVLNGVDMETNSHDTGSRAILSGAGPEGTPAIGALLAASHGPTQPIPFISFGGYDSTFGLAPLTRVSSGNVLRGIAFPNVISPENPDSASYHTAATYARIREAQAERMQSLLELQQLPNLRRAKEALIAARATDADLQALDLPELVDFAGNTADMERMVQGAQLALAGFKSGLTVSANVVMGGFDTHGNHDQNQTRQVIKLISGIGHILDEIDKQGLSDKVNVVVGSDFGRGPHYNGENNNSGKDHWPISSTLVFGPGVEGDRVIGATTDEQLAQLVDPMTLQAGSSGVKLRPAEIHLALRNLAEIDPALIAAYPLAGTELPLFG